MPKRLTEGPFMASGRFVLNLYPFRRVVRWNHPAYEHESHPMEIRPYETRRKGYRMYHPRPHCSVAERAYRVLCGRRPVRGHECHRKLRAAREAASDHWALYGEPA